MAALVHKLRHSLSEHLRRRAEFYWAPLLYTLAVYFLYREVFGAEAGFGWDSIESYWPDLVFFSDELQSGHWPHWNPFDRGGYPYSSDPQPGIYYPVQWLCAGLGMLFDTSWWLIQFKMLLHHVIAGLCMHAFLRHRGLPKTASVIGGLALIASTPWLIHKASNLLWPMVWAPLLWIATDRLLERPCFRRSAALAFVVYLAGSAGSPPGFFYVLLMAALYGLFRSSQSLVGKRKSPELWPYSGKLAAAILGAALLALALLWVSVSPALQLSEFSPRQNRDLNYALSMPLAMLPTLKALVVPTAGQVDAYGGILVLLLGLCGIAIQPERDRGAPIFFALAALFFLALSFGGQLPLLGALVTHIPGFGLFRISSRYKCLFAPMLAVLAAYGATNLLHLRARSEAMPWRLLAIAGGSLALVLYLLLANPLDPQLVHRFPSWTTPLTLSVLALAMILAAGLRQERAAVFVIAMMPLLMLGDTPRYWHHQQLFLEKKVDHHEDLAKLEGLEGVLDLRYRIYDEFVLGQRPGSRLQIRDFRGYPSGDPLDFRRYRDVLAKAGQHPELLEAYNVRYLFHGRHHRSGSASQRIKVDPSTHSPKHFVRRSALLHEARHPVPIVAWYGAIQVLPTNQVLDALLDLEDEQGERHYALLEEDQPLDARLRSLEAQRSEAPASVAGTLLEFETDRVQVEIQAPQPGLVVLNEVGFPGWTVFVDGKQQPVLTANYLLRAVSVDAGTHRIEWRYSPKGHSLAITLYGLALLLLLLALASQRDIWRRLKGGLTKRS